MTCKDILPQIDIEAIEIKELENFEAVGGPEKASFSPLADEKFETVISHTNKIEIQNFLDSLSFEDLFNAEVLSPDFYKVKFMLTNSETTYNLISDAINFINQVEYLGDGLTASEIIQEKKN